MFVLTLLPSLLATSPFLLISQDSESATDDKAEKNRPEYSISIPTDLEVIPSEGGKVEVPVRFQHNGVGPYDVLRVGFDYEELLLHFKTTDVSLEGTVATHLRGIQHDAESGTITLEVEFDPGRAIKSEETLIKLYFGMTLSTFALDPEDHYSPAVVAPIRVIEDDIFLSRSDEKSIDLSPVMSTRDGSVALYLHDMIELQSAELTHGSQRFRIPVYVTHLTKTRFRFEMELRYDMRYLRLVDVEVTSDLVLPLGSMEWLDQPEFNREPATIVVHFPHGMFPKMLRHHLLDLIFEYDSSEGLPGNGMLTLAPAVGGDRYDSSVVDITEGHLLFMQREFVRGDIDASLDVGILDVIKLLDAIYNTGLGALPCMEAADVYDNSYISLQDALALIRYLYFGRSPPPPPFPNPGPDPDPDTLGCDTYGPEVFRLLPAD